MKKLNELKDKCKASVTITINQHKDYLQTVQQYFDDLLRRKEIDEEDLEPNIVLKMIDTDTIIDIQFYPNTPVGFYRVFHYDLELAINECLKTF